MTDACDLVAKVPEALFGADTAVNGANTGLAALTTGVAGSWSSMLACKVTPPWSAGTQLKFLFVYPLPWDLQFSAIYQNFPGVPVTATYAVTNGIVGPSLGRNIAACGANCAPTSSFGNIELMSPGMAYEDRQQEVDLRFPVRVLMVHLNAMGYEETLDQLPTTNSQLPRRMAGSSTPSSLGIGSWELGF